MKVLLCVFIVAVFLTYLLLYSRKAVEPELTVKGILSGEKLGYMMTSLAFGSKRTATGNGISLRTIKKYLVKARKTIGNRDAAGKRLEDCEKTFFDNFYYIDKTLRSVSSVRRRLSKLPHVSGVPRLYSFCELLVKSAGGVISAETLRSALNSYCSETPLTFYEILSLEDMFKAALCEYLAIFARKMTRMRELTDKGEHDAAEGCIDYTLLKYDSYVFGRYGNSSPRPERDNEYGRYGKKLDGYLLHVANYNAHISAAVGSLHSLKALFTDEFVNTLSPAYDVLNEGDKTFCKLTESTKRMYLYEICHTAKRRKTQEKSVASEILFRASRDSKDISGYILPKVYGKSVQRLYALCIAAATIAAMVATAFIIPRLGWLYSLFAIPIFLFAIDFVSRKISKHAVKRRYLPSYDVEKLPQDSCRTAIVVPCLAASEDDIDAAFEHLLTVAAANNEKIFSYCLLFDYKKSKTEVADTDAALNEKLRERFARLGSLEDRTCVMVRRRKRVAGEEYYQGYEKKRGAVMDFCRSVVKGENEFAVLLGSIPEVKYAVTLDSDTLTCDCAGLVGIKAHPYCKNAAVLSVNCKAAKKDSFYSRLYAGETGPGRYRLTHDGIAFDLFGAGNFTGKGIFDVNAFFSQLENFFPDNRILSHDYIEGAAAGCMDTSVNASEDFPATFADSFARDIRWLRGDWQLLPYTCLKVKNKDGKKVPNPLSPLAVFTIACNLILSLVPIAQITLLFLMLFTSPYLSAVILMLSPQLLRLVYAAPSVVKHGRQVSAEFCRCVFEIALLPTVAAYKFCAVCVTLYRLATGRKLLEWSVFAHTKGKISVMPNIVFAIVVAATAAVFGLSVFFYAAAALFAAGAALPAVTSRVDIEKERSVSVAARLTDVARSTFSYFAKQEELYRLPCDCFQVDNSKGWCARTSPTNIGMALTSYASAYELGLVDKDRFISYVEHIISAVEECEKYKGNLYNWYDCKTLKVLPRRFVSTVDSGNFMVSLSLVSVYTEGELHDRIVKLIDETDIGALFDKKRKLLYIGYDDELKACTDNHYDLLGSESTLTYLAACGYGKIPKEAFYNLDRSAVRYKGAVTVYSWTGGMFEYLMSRIFVAPGNDTLYGNAMKEAVRAQIRYAKSRDGGMWGVSECRYNGYDDCGGNLYRAFGVPGVAHSSVPAEPPFAPYAAFLALPYCGDGEFLTALDAYTDAGMAGETGYYESYDGVPVRSYMTHHQGMILASCANALKHDCLVKRLLTLPQWRFALLLCGEEKNTRGSVKKVYSVSKVEKPMADAGVYLCRCADMSAVATLKETFADYCGKRILQGIRVISDDGGGCDLLRGDFYASGNAVWKTGGNGFMSEAEMCVLPSPLSVAVRVKYRNTSSRRGVRFRICAQPVLAVKEDYEAHPAYSRMFIETGEGADGKYVWARRKKDGVTLLHCVSADSHVVYGGDKCEFYDRGRGAEYGQNLNPLLSSSFSAELGTGEYCAFTCYFLVADTCEQAEYAVKLASSPDCVKRIGGASIGLTRAVSENARTVAANLIKNAYPAVKADGVSMDKPGITYEVTNASLPVLGKFLDDMRILYRSGFSFNTVLFCRKRRNEYPASYFDAEREVERSGIRTAAERRGAVRVIDCDNDVLYSRLKNHSPDTCAPKRITWLHGKIVPYADADFSDSENKIRYSECFDDLSPEIVHPLGMGGFGKDLSYIADITDTDTPAPWCNIMSNGHIGTLITESGGGFTFGENSRQQKISAWNNDPVEEKVSELVALTCGGKSWSVTKKPITVRAKYTAEHARGYSRFTCDYIGVRTRLTEFLSRDEDRKIYELEIFNRSDKKREFGVYFGIRPVLGDFASNTVSSLEWNVNDCGLHLRCPASGNEAYLYCDRKTVAAGADIADNDLIIYDELHKCEEFLGITTGVTVPAESTLVLRFSLSAQKPDAFDNAENAFFKSCNFYSKLGGITFDGEFGYLTEWLPYQVYNSRFEGRTGFYQVSGAYGFRDQLQDCLTLLYCDPGLVRGHILECAKHQFKEGDVQHWWHPPAIGVRTHVCDDRLWMVYTVCEYIAFTGDKSILDEHAPFLADVPISPEDRSVYTAAEYSRERASIFEHCLRAIAVSMDFAANGLVRMRGGDWNDAMDKVGEKGDGSSVWCTMFAYHVIDKFMPYVKDVELCDKLRKLQKRLYAAVSRAYEDDRFLRAYKDDGEPLGSKHGKSCRIDLLTQSWCVIAGIGTTEQKTVALDSAYGILCDAENKIIKLFDPPFTSSDGVGYIGDYPAYVRENGGQYTQAAVWYVWALFENGQTERANELLKWLSPAHRCSTSADTLKYCVEPYVSAADVYGGELAGKGGWTWYTGSASWLYKCLIEKYAGIKVRGDTVSFCPNLPADTRELNVTFLFSGERIRVKIVNSQNRGEWRIRIGEVIYNTSALRLTKGLSSKNIAVIRLIK